MGIFKHASMNVFLKSMLRMKYKIIVDIKANENKYYLYHLIVYYLAKTKNELTN